MGTSTSKNFFLFHICKIILTQRFQYVFFNLNLSSVKRLFVESLRAEQTTFSMEKISFSLKLSFGHFYGQSCIATVQGPLFINIKTVVNL